MNYKIKKKSILSKHYIENCCSYYLLHITICIKIGFQKTFVIAYKRVVLKKPNITLNKLTLTNHI